MPQGNFPSSKYFLMVSVGLIKTCPVEWFCLKTNCKGQKRSLLLQNLKILVYISISKYFVKI